MPNRKNTLPKDLQPVPTYSSRNGEYELYGLMYSPSEKALYNSAFLKKKINVKGKSGFYTYQKGESGLDRKRVYVSVDRFLKQHPQYNDILDEISEKSVDKSVSDKSDKSNAKPDESSSYDYSDDKSNDDKSISENELFNTLKNYK